MSDHNDEQVGYGRPPPEHRFKPGHKKVGGRRKKAKPQSSASHILDRQIEMTVDGKREMVSAGDAVLMQQLQKALAGDTRSAQLITKINAEREALKSQVGWPDAVAPLAPPTIIFSKMPEGSLSKLGVLAERAFHDENRRLATWVARAALMHIGPDIWEDPDAVQLAHDLEDPMAVIDLVPAELRAEWTDRAQRPHLR